MWILILYVLAILCFVLAAGGVTGRVNLVALGLAAWVGAVIVQRYHP